ncbi:RDD family protein [Streptacidiphilus fuscans]|uniref:RDD family protein n=1 Tax=Streptacidiphilus fuscans TaxID=2789292 RepID=A0A931B713_9ACTN|nr:RDD family protein [Streptacidiphilus fuscans]MBF9071413.1 RDD family protein [Streptacidiphilus fuscans]
MQKNPVDSPFAAGTRVSELRVVGDHDLASFGARFGAAALDTVVIAVLYLACLRLPGMGNSVLALVVLTGIRLLYGALQLQFGGGRTLGMRAFRIKVKPVGTERGRLTAGQAWLRTAVFALPAAVLGVGAYLSILDCLWMLWDRPNQQTLHDKAARTVVVRA